MATINLCPHDCVIVDETGKVVKTIPTSGIIARVAVTVTPTGETIDGIPVTKSVYGDPVNLPDPVSGTIYIVSRVVYDACPDRTDLYIPNESVRDERGQIVGCKSITRP